MIFSNLNNYTNKYLSINNLYIFLLIVICLLQILYAGKVDVNNYPPEHDIQSYRRLALASPQIDYSVGRPFIYRFFTPWLVGFLFQNVDNGFLILNTLFLIVYVIIIYFFLLEYKVSPFISFYLTIAFIFNRYFISYYAFEFYRLPDLISNSFLLLSIIFLKKQKYFILLILSIIGVLSRETALLIIPTGLAYIYFNGTRKHLILFVSYSIIIAFFYIIPRLTIYTPEGHSLLQAIIAYWKKIITPQAVIKQLFITFNPLFLIPVIQLKEFVTFNKKRLYLFILLIFTLLSSIFGGDMERLMMPYVPIYYLFIATIFQKFYESGKINHIKMILFVIICWLSNLYHLWGLIRLPSRVHSMVLTLIGGISILLLFIKLKTSLNDGNMQVNGLDKI